MEVLYYLAAKYSFTAPPCVDSYIYKKDFSYFCTSIIE